MTGDTYIFYADVYFIQNFIIKTGILWLTIKTMKIPVSKALIRCVGIAAIGTIVEILCLFLISNYRVFLVLNHIIFIPGMLFLIYGTRWEILRRSLLWGYFYALVMNGVIEFYWILWGSGWFYPLLVLAACISVVIGSCCWLQRQRMSKGVYPIDIDCGHIVWSTRGYYDSGNCLKDPYTGKGVHIISSHLFHRLHLENKEKVSIPYQSMGNPNGLMDVYYIEGVEIKRENEKIKLHKVPLGVAEDALFAGKVYEIIMNEEVW